MFIWTLGTVFEVIGWVIVIAWFGFVIWAANRSNKGR